MLIIEVGMIISLCLCLGLYCNLLCYVVFDGLTSLLVSSRVHSPIHVSIVVHVSAFSNIYIICLQVQYNDMFSVLVVVVLLYYIVLYSCSLGIVVICVTCILGIQILVFSYGICSLLFHIKYICYYLYLSVCYLIICLQLLSVCICIICIFILIYNMISVLVSSVFVFIHPLYLYVYSLVCLGILFDTFTILCALLISLFLFVISLDISIDVILVLLFILLYCMVSVCLCLVLSIYMILCICFDWFALLITLRYVLVYRSAMYELFNNVVNMCELIGESCLVST